MMFHRVLCAHVIGKLGIKLTGIYLNIISVLFEVIKEKEHPYTNLHEP